MKVYVSDVTQMSATTCRVSYSKVSQWTDNAVF